MKILSNGFEIHETGTLISPGLDDITFVLSETPKMQVVFRVKNTEGKAQSIDLEVINEYTIAFIFTNPEDLGFGNSSPVKIGHLNGREIYVSFHLNMKSNYSSFELTYTFMLKEAQNV